MTASATHWWLYAITVENEFRNSRAHVEYRWYNASITRFESSWAAGVLPSRNRPEARIRVYYNEQQIGAYASKDEALGQVRQLLLKCPATCRTEVEAHTHVLFCAISGERP